MLESFFAGAIFVALVLTPLALAAISHPDRANLTRNHDIARHDIAL
jgi:hypothetical protein